MTSEFQGKLQVTVLRARDLAVDLTGYTDPYCVLCIDKQKFRTKTISKNANPIWEQTFVFNVTRPLCSLDIVVWDENTVKNDQFRGKASYSLLELSDQQQVQKWLPLKKRTDKDNVSGDVLVSAQFKYLPVWDAIYKGCIAVQQRNFSAGLRLLDESITKYPDLEALYGFRSEVYVNTGKFKEAMEDAQQIIKLNPNIAEGYYRIGAVFFAIEDYTQAEESFKLGIKWEPDDDKCALALQDMKKNTIRQQVRNAIIRGRQAFEKEEFTLATNYFDEAIEKNPKNCTYYVMRAIVKLVQLKHSEALEDSLKIVQIQPNWPKNNPIKQGYVMKQGKVNVMMKRRWFILKERFIFYYNSSKDLKANGVILLGQDFELQKSQKKLFRIGTGSRTFELKAETEEERDSWIEVLENLLNSKISLPPTDENEETEVFLEAQNQKGNFASLTDILSTTVSTTAHVVYMPGTIAHSLAGKISSKLTSVTLDGASKEGYLYKMGQFNKGFKKRYWVLKESTLYYCKISQEDAKKAASITPNGSIVLDPRYKVVLAQEKAQKEFAFEIITPNRRYLVSASTEPEMNEWIETISKTIGDNTPILKEDSKRTTVIVSQADIYKALKEQEEEAETQRARRNSGLPKKAFNNELKPVEETSPRSKATEPDEDMPSMTFGSQKYTNAEARYFTKFGLTPPSTEYTTTSISITNQVDDAGEDDPFLLSLRDGNSPRNRKSEKQTCKCCCIQ